MRARPRHRRKDRERHLRIVGRIASKARAGSRRAKGNAVLPNLEVGMRREADPTPKRRQPRKQRSLRHRSLLHRLRHSPPHGARVPEIKPHPVRRIDARLRGPKRRRGSLILRQPVQSVVIAPMPKMQKRAHLHKELARLPQTPAMLAQLSSLSGKRSRSSHFAYVRVTQPARTLLDVRLQVEDGVAVLCMPQPCDLQQPARAALTLPRQQLRQHLLHATGGVTACVSRHVPRIQQRQRKLDIFRFEPPALRQRSRQRRRPQTAVPESSDSACGPAPSPRAPPPARSAETSGPHPRRETAPDVRTHPPPPAPRPRRASDPLRPPASTPIRRSASTAAALVRYRGSHPH